MTFMYGYSLLKKGWGPEHKTLAKWDLTMTMFLPFAVITSLIMIGMTVSGIYDVNNVHGLRDVVRSAMQPLEAAKALESEFISQRAATIIFCCGLFGMTCGAISAHMTCCGFVMCEMLGLDHTKRNFRIFALTPSIGFFGVVVGLPFWFPIAASAVCLTMLPIAYLIFLILNNKRSYIGDAVGKGLSREIFNVLLVIALLMASIGAFINVKARVYDVLFPPKVVQKL
jgi:succinate dehydrogenase hydrophobic anchor subunit